MMKAMRLKRIVPPFLPALMLALVCLGVTEAAFSMSEEDEIKLGEQEHRKIIAQFGVYGDKDLAAYVTKVGERVAAVSSRAELKFHFTILNDDMINAFALPGGYVYVTRGILMHMNSESELAAVLGHEIAHITEKHAMKAQTQAKVMDVLTAIGSMVLGTPGLYEIGNLFGGVLLTGYSREFELEADQVGAEFMAKAGYSPEAMLKTIDILKAKDRIEIEEAHIEHRQPEVYHGFLSSHPDNDTRYREAIKESKKLLKEYQEFVKYDEFLEKLNGLAYGSPRQVGVVRKNTFYHPKLGIKFSFPAGWRVATTNQGVQVVSTIRDASLAITTSRIAKGEDAKKFLTEKLGMSLREGRDVTIAGLPGYIGIADRGDSPYGPRPIRVVALFDNRKRLAYILTGAGQYDLHRVAADRDFIAIAFSFDLMTRDDQRLAKAPRIQIVRAEKDTTMEALAAQSPITNYALDRLRVMNGLYPDGEPEPGQLIKIVD